MFFSRARGETYEIPNRGPSLQITDMVSFLAATEQVEAQIQTYNEKVSAIAKLHGRILHDIDSGQLHSQLDELVKDTRQLAQSIRARIKELQSLRDTTRHGLVREKRAELLRERFSEAVQNYHNVEQKYNAAQRIQAEHQIRIVKPSATDKEVQDILGDTPNGQIFQQALMNNHQRKAQDAYHAVQARHNDILRITKTMVELSQLMDDLALAVEQDQDKINIIESNAEKVEKDAEQGLKESNIAKKLMEKIRRKKVICFFIFLLVVIIIAAAVGGSIAAQNARKKIT
ncbi:Plasma membrane t-SNARE, secretory vesicle fusion [Serendipita sp. 401]|nr:Plasma membrane t-SNARE, secretory vesicle fusion [Serendipita sp. 401]